MADDAALIRPTATASQYEIVIKLLGLMGG
jgi:hypothetical protein